MIRCVSVSPSLGFVLLSQRVGSVLDYRSVSMRGQGRFPILCLFGTQGDLRLPCIQLGAATLIRQCSEGGGMKVFRFGCLFHSWFWCGVNLGFSLPVVSFPLLPAQRTPTSSFGSQCRNLYEVFGPQDSQTEVFGMWFVLGLFVSFSLCLFSGSHSRMRIPRGQRFCTFHLWIPRQTSARMNIR